MSISSLVYHKIHGIYGRTYCIITTYFFENKHSHTIGDEILLLQLPSKVICSAHRWIFVATRLLPSISKFEADESPLATLIQGFLMVQIVPDEICIIICRSCNNTICVNQHLETELINQPTTNIPTVLIPSVYYLLRHLNLILCKKTFAPPYFFGKGKIHRFYTQFEQWDVSNGNGTVY